MGRETAALVLDPDVEVGMVIMAELVMIADVVVTAVAEADVGEVVAGAGIDFKFGTVKYSWVFVNQKLSNCLSKFDKF